MTIASRVTTRLASIAAIAFVLNGCGGGGVSGGNSTFAVVQQNLAADTAGSANATDSNLINPWGISTPVGGPFYVSDNGKGIAGIYFATGASVNMTVKIPGVSSAAGKPTGQLYNASSDFTIGSTGPALFIFCGADGIISAWNNSSGVNATAMADRSGTGAVYTGVAIGSKGSGNNLYAANFRTGAIDVFDKNFHYTGSFTDPSIPSGYAPFNVMTINGKLYVTFAAQGPPGSANPLSGIGSGYIDIFDQNGTLTNRLVSNGALNAPWGLAIAPSSYGVFAGALLVANHGDGTISAFDAGNGSLIGQLTTAQKAAIVIPGLWGLNFGTGGFGGQTSAIYFTAGPSNGTHGLFGTLTPVS